MQNPTKKTTKKYTSSKPTPSNEEVYEDESNGIREFIGFFKDGTVNVTDEVSYNLSDVIDENYRLFNSKFEEPTDSAGLEKIFFNIGWILYRTVFFSSDIDQKDLQMRSKNVNAVAGVALLRMSVENYLDRLHFGKTIDDIRAYMIAHGTAITKIAHGEPELVDLRNIVRPPHIEDIQKSGLAERTFYTYEEIKEIKNLSSEAEERIEKLWEKMQKEKIYLFPVYEYWHEFEIKGKIRKGCKRFLDCDLIRPEQAQGTKASWDPYTFLDSFRTPYKKRRTSRALIKKYGEYEDIYPYKQVNFIDVPGRWLGFGVFEMVKGLQIYYNEKWHLYRKKDILDLRGIFKHKKGTTNSSLEQRFLDAMETGAFVDLEEDEDLDRLIIDMKTGEFIASIEKILELARQIVGVTAQGIGQDMPSTTTATVGVLNQKTQQTTYDYVIERMSHFLTALFEDFYMGVILEEISEEEMFYITGDPSELRELDRVFAENLINSEAERYKDMNGRYPDAMTVDQWRTEIMQSQEKLGTTRYPELIDDVIKKLPFTVQFYVNSDRFDKAVQVQNLTQMLQDPNFSGSRAKVEEALLDLIGLDGRQFRKTAEEKKAELEALAAQEAIKNGPIGVPAPLGMGQQFGNASNPVQGTA